MKGKYGSWILALLVFFLAAGLQAQVNLPAGTTNIPAQLEQQGWHPVAPGVFQRERPGQPLETIALGSEGLPRALQELRHRFLTLSDTYEKTPTPELEKALSHLKVQMGDLEKTIATLKPGAAPALPEGCNFSFGCGPNAYPLGDVQGVGADSWSYFYNDCSYQATAYADAQGSTNSGYDFQARAWTDYNVYQSAAVRTPGGPSCFSDALCYVNAPGLGLYYQNYASNSSCPVPVTPLTVNLYGPSYISVFGYECVTEYWSASASGGTPPYSYSWNYGGGGDTFSATFCGSGENYTEYFYVSVTAYDSGGQNASRSMTTTVRYQGGDICPYYRPYCDPYPY